MARQQIAVILDTDLPLHDGERQIADDGANRTDDAVDRGIKIVDLRKAEALVQQQRVQRHRQNVRGDAADRALDGFLRADDRSQLMLAAGAADKVGAAVCHHGQHKCDQNEILAVLHPAQAHQRADQEGIDDAAEKRHAQRGELQLRVRREQLAEQCAEIDEQADKHAHPERLLGNDRAGAHPRPHHGRRRHHRGIDQNPLVLQDPRAPEHLIRRDHAGRSEEDRRRQRRQKQHDRQQQRQADAGNQNSSTHYFAPPNRRLRPL